MSSQNPYQTGFFSKELARLSSLTRLLYASTLKRILPPHISAARWKEGRTVPKDHEPTKEEWRELARQAIEEEDLEKTLELVQQALLFRKQKGDEA